MENKKENKTASPPSFALRLGNILLGASFLTALVGWNSLRAVDPGNMNHLASVLNAIVGVAAGFAGLGLSLRLISVCGGKGAPGEAAAANAGLAAAVLWIADEMMFCHWHGFTRGGGFLRITLLLALTVVFMVFPGAGEGSKDGEPAGGGKDDKKSGWGAFAAICAVIIYVAFNSTLFSGMFSKEKAPVKAAATNAVAGPEVTPARHDEISKAFVSIGSKRLLKPTGCGVFVGDVVDGKRQVSLMTAAHIARTLFELGDTNSIVITAYRGKGKEDLSINLPDLGFGWSKINHYADIAMLNVTPYFDGLVRNGWDVKYIPISAMPRARKDEREVEGSFMLTTGFFPSYGVGLGSPIIAYGNAYELEPLAKMACQPLGLRSGIIAARSEVFPDHGPDAPPMIIVECNTYPGYSGGPVFASAQIGLFSYPALIGVTGGGVTVNALPDQTKAGRTFQSGYCYVTPLDTFIKSVAEIERGAKESK
ncbi:MAG: hypothetical protein K6F50_01840 [Kiritimatiellae bacterium]|nr:hypothetical protein [Kiritimatiellia bacterium]